MENTVKKTKVMYFTELREMVENWVDREDQADLLDFIDKQIETLEKRKAAAKERAEKKKVESDVLTDQIYEVIGDDLMTVDEIVVTLDNEEVTRNKVTARLGKLVKAGVIEKDSVKVEGAKRMAYRRVQEETEAVAE